MAAQVAELVEQWTTGSRAGEKMVAFACGANCIRLPDLFQLTSREFAISRPSPEKKVELGKSGKNCENGQLAVCQLKQQVDEYNVLYTSDLSL